MVHIQKYMPCHGGYDHQLRCLPMHMALIAAALRSPNPQTSRSSSLGAEEEAISYGNMLIYRVS